MQTSGINAQTSSAQTPEKLRKVAREFESLFTSMMLKSMRDTVGDNPLIPAGFGEKVYTEMLDDHYAELISKQGSLGLADMIVKQLELNGIDNPSIDELKNLKNDSWRIDNRFIPSTNTNNKPISSNIHKWDDLIEKAGSEHGVDSNLIRAIITQESGGNPYAVSQAGAKGLMQLMDSTAQDMGVYSSFSPQANILGGTRYLRQMLDRYDGNETLALASYNAGPVAVDKYKGIPPYQETRNYVDSVLRLKNLFASDSQIKDK